MRKLGDLSSDLQSRPQTGKLVKPFRPRDGFFDFLRDSLSRMAGMPTEVDQTNIHVAVVYRVELDESWLPFMGTDVLVRARIMEPDMTHCTLAEPISFEDNTTIDLLPQFMCDLEQIGGNPPKVGDPIEVEFKNPDLKTKTFGNGIIRSILNKQKVQGIYDRSPFLDGKHRKSVNPLKIKSPAEECISARKKFGDINPPGGQAIRGKNKELTVSPSNPRKLDSPTDDSPLAQAENLIENNPNPRRPIRVKRNGPLDKDGDGFIDDDIYDQARYNIMKRRFATDLSAGIGVAATAFQVVNDMRSGKAILKAAKSRRFRSALGEATQTVAGGGLLNALETPQGETTGLGALIAGIADPLTGGISIVETATRTAGFDTDRRRIIGHYIGAPANPNDRIQKDLEKRKFKGQIDCDKIYSVKNFIESKNLFTPSSRIPEEYKNKGPVPDVWDRPSNRRIMKLHPDARHAVAEFINMAASMGMFLRVTETYRTAKRQDELYAKGRSVDPVGKDFVVTYARGTPPSSIHQFGIAIDVVEIPRGVNSITREKFAVEGANWASGFDKKYPRERWQIIGDLGKQFGFRWGGDFRKFKDLPHFEIFDRSPSRLRRRIARGEILEDASPTPSPPYIYPKLTSG